MGTSRSTGGKSGNTFVVRIIDTDDREWIGIVSHIQSGRKKTFRGFIEAVRFIDGFVAADAEGARGASGSLGHRSRTGTNDSGEIG